jgi:hypothetical protein
MTEACIHVAEVHDRMPVILKREDWGDWLGLAVERLLKMEWLMAELVGKPEEVLGRVQEIAREIIPDIVCELQDYRTGIGCGLLDEKGQLQQVRWRLRHLSESRVETELKALASHLTPRLTIHRK